MIDLNNQKTEKILEKEIEITPEIERDWPGIRQKIEARKYHNALFESMREEMEEIEKLEAFSVYGIFIPSYFYERIRKHRNLNKNL